MRRSPVLPLVLLALLAACSEAGPADPLAPTGPAFATAAGAQHYVIVANRWQLPSDLEASVQAAGGTLTGRIDRIGVATATSDNPDFIRAMEAVPGIQAAAPDLSMRWTDPDPGTPMLDGASGVGPAGIGDDETYFSYQWAPRAIHAPEAWAAGYTGAGVRVAIIDGGIYHAHIDLRDNIDAAHSRSFVPGKAWNEDVGTFWHGTHVAGIVAAEDNGIGTIGVAPHATLIGVKALDNGSGDFSWILDAIVYAGTPLDAGGAGADVINMSLSGAFYKQGFPALQDAYVKLANALDRACTYATQNGTLVIAAAANDGVNLDLIANIRVVPAMSTNVVAVSATAPSGFAYGGTDFDTPASYTNYGQRVIDFAAPGGDFDYPAPFYYYDMVLSTVRGSGASTSTYSWAAGTSMAAPHVAGVAALIIQANGGHITPAQVLAALRHGADDLGKPGNDDYYGSGRVNAFASVQ